MSMKREEKNILGGKKHRIVVRLKSKLICANINTKITTEKLNEKQASTYSTDSLSTNALIHFSFLSMTKSQQLMNRDDDFSTALSPG